MKQELSTCFYPTSVLLVDDNQNFLLALKQLLGLKNPLFRYNTFNDPRQALDYTNESSLAFKESSLKCRPDDYSDAEQFIIHTLNRQAAQRTIKQPDELSVVVVDLDMPGIDGIEFCRRIRDPNIKKILLTGISAMDRVLQAFNDKVIHYYLNKADENMDGLLDTAIKRLQHEYFLDVSNNFNSEAFTEIAPLIYDEAFADFFEELCAAFDISEYYFQTQPYRYHLLSKDGSEKTLLITTDEQLDKHIQIMEEEDAPQRLIQAIKTKKYIPNFGTLDGFYLSDLMNPETSLIEADRIEGKVTYYYALIEGDLKSVCPSTPNLNTPSRLH